MGESLTDLPRVEMELFTFLKIVWFLVELQHAQARIERAYAESSRSLLWGPRG